jgi:Flp pilus assembly protein TadB
MKKGEIFMENNTFNYTHSAAKNKEVENIRKKYMPHEESKLEKLKKLDLRAQTAGMIESLCIGIVGSLVFGVGMCFFLKVFTGELWVTVLFMLLGVLLMLPAYPIYKHISKKTRKKLTPEILRLSEEVIRESM